MVGVSGSFSFDTFFSQMDTDEHRIYLPVFIRVIRGLF